MDGPLLQLVSALILMSLVVCPAQNPPDFLYVYRLVLVDQQQLLDAHDVHLASAKTKFGKFS